MSVTRIFLIPSYTVKGQSLGSGRETHFWFRESPEVPECVRPRHGNGGEKEGKRVGRSV